MLLIAFYSRPFADDYAYSAGVHKALGSGHYLLGVFRAVADEVVLIYKTWQGSFSAVALFSLQPGVFGKRAYIITAVILIGIFVLGNYCFFRKVLKDKTTAFIVFAAVCILSTQFLPHALQGFYWWNGGSYYTLFYSLMLIQWGMLFERKKVIIPCILGFILGGGNLVSGLLNVEVTALFLLTYILFRVADKKTSGNRQGGELDDISLKAVIRTAVILLFSAAGFMINVLAPGNAVRGADSVFMSPLKAIGSSFIEAYRYCNEWLNMPLVLTLMFLFPFLWHYAKGRGSRIPFVVLAFLAFGLFASMFTPTLYSMSEVGPRRVQNIRYFMFVVAAVLLELEACKHTRELVEGRIYFAPGHEFVSAYLRGYMLILLCGVLVILGIYTIPKENRNSLPTIAASRSLLIGEAGKYATERDTWLEALESEDRVVTLEKIQDRPVLIYYSDLDVQGDPEDYRDQCVFMYYDKDRIILED
jgi:hypothetical protein